MYNSYYPTDQVGRQQLADELTAKGLRPTQTKQCFDADKINKMVDAMKDGSFVWNAASLQPVILGPNGEVLNGHHRVIAAHLAGIDLTAIAGVRPQVQRVARNFSAGVRLDRRTPGRPMMEAAASTAKTVLKLPIVDFHDNEQLFGERHGI